MDWNRRWAKKRFLPSIAWHKAWADNVEKIAILAKNKWIKFLTLWGLSTDNLNKRDEVEVKDLIKIINSVKKYLKNIMNEWWKIEVIWDIQKLPQESQDILYEMIENTKDNSMITIVLALVYWWQDEIIRATKNIIKEWINPDNLTKEEFRKYTDSGRFPKVDMIVRPGWDNRHSWFLLFDSEYAEYHFTDKMWPDYNEDELDKTIELFDKANRRFWK
jgi:undecaprenyl diphosphate synthase